MSAARTLYQSGRSRTLWALLFVVLLPVAITFWLLTLPSTEQLLTDFGSLNAARLWQAGMLLLSSIMFWPFLWLSGRYVTQVELAAPGQINVEVWTLFGPQRREWKSAFNPGEFHEGHLYLPYTPEVHAPWTGYRTPEGKRLIVDEQGEFPLGREALQRAMTGSGE